MRLAEAVAKCPWPLLPSEHGFVDTNTGALSVFSALFLLEGLVRSWGELVEIQRVHTKIDPFESCWWKDDSRLEALGAFMDDIAMEPSILYDASEEPHDNESKLINRRVAEWLVASEIPTPDSHEVNEETCTLDAELARKVVDLWVHEAGINERTRGGAAAVADRPLPDGAALFDRIAARCTKRLAKLESKSTPTPSRPDAGTEPARR